MELVVGVGYKSALLTSEMDNSCTLDNNGLSPVLTSSINFE